MTISKGFLLFDVMLSLLLVGLYLPLVIQGIFSLNMSVSRIYDYHANLIQLQAHMNDRAISFEPIFIYDNSEKITTFFTDIFGLHIRWVDHTP